MPNVAIHLDNTTYVATHFQGMQILKMAQIQHFHDCIFENHYPFEFSWISVATLWKLLTVHVNMASYFVEENLMDGQLTAKSWKSHPSKICSYICSYSYTVLHMHS